MTPMVLIKGQIHNRFVRSFLYYVPYVTLAVMTFPDIVLTTPTPLPGMVALLAGIIAAWLRLGLFPVAAICCIIVYLML
jgi:branched-subunit amino acid transport protein